MIIGLGQLAAGDDAVGLLVARALGARECADASLVLALLEDQRVVIVDAVVGGGAPGDVLELDPAALATGPQPVSTHGLGVAEAIAMARTLYGTIDVAIVGIVIERRTGDELSPAVAAAVPRAVELARALAR